MGDGSTNLFGIVFYTPYQPCGYRDSSYRPRAVVASAGASAGHAPWREPIDPEGVRARPLWCAFRTQAGHRARSEKCPRAVIRKCSPCARSGLTPLHATWGLHAMTPSVRARTSGEARQVATASKPGAPGDGATLIGGL